MHSVESRARHLVARFVCILLGSHSSVHRGCRPAGVQTQGQADMETAAFHTDRGSGGSCCGDV